MGMLKRGVALALWLLAAFTASAGPSDRQVLAYRQVLDKYCVTCHDQRLKTGGLTLDSLDLAKVPEQAEVWEKVI